MRNINGPRSTPLFSPPTPPAPSDVSGAKRGGGVRLRGGFRSSLAYRLLLLGPAPKRLRFPVPQLWPGNPDVGRALIQGIFSHEDESHTLTAADALPAASPAWTAWFHGLGWLNDLSALGGGEAPYFAREWLTVWMAANAKWDARSWAPDVTAERLINICQNWAFLMRDDGCGGLEKLLHRQAGRDARHLFHSLPPANCGYVRFHALKGQVYGAFALLGGEGRMNRTLQRLADDIQNQILPDGGHVERNPERLADMLKDLLELKVLLSTATGDVPGFLQNAIDRVAPMLRALRHPDGGLALFNGGLEGNRTVLDLILAQTDSTAKAPFNGPHAGFQRAGAGTLYGIMDCGQPTKVGKAQHAGALSFELSSGKHRIIVNCGSRSGASDPWRTALAATAAHSTLTVNDTSLASFALDGALRSGPEHVTCTRKDLDEGTLIEASHDGYMPPFGLIHQRALFIASHGTDVRGEDRLVGTGGNQYTLRFHLHPNVKASLLGDGHGVLLRVGGKEVWRFRTSADQMALESSVYLGHKGEHRRTEQIVISGPLSGNGALIKWALSRDDH